MLFVFLYFEYGILKYILRYLPLVTCNNLLVNFPVKFFAGKVADFQKTNFDSNFSLSSILSKGHSFQCSNSKSSTMVNHVNY